MVLVSMDTDHHHHRHHYYQKTCQHQPCHEETCHGENTCCRPGLHAHHHQHLYHHHPCHHNYCHEEATCCRPGLGEGAPCSPKDLLLSLLITFSAINFTSTKHYTLQSCTLKCTYRSIPSSTLGYIYVVNPVIFGLQIQLLTPLLFIFQFFHTL